MGFERPRLWMLGPLCLFACGAGGVLALQAHLYACTLVLCLVGLWLAASSRHEAMIRPLRRAPFIGGQTTMPWRLLNAALDQIPAPLLLVEASGVPKAANRAARVLFDTDDRLILPPKALLEALGAQLRDGRSTVQFDIQSEMRTYAMSMIDLIDLDGPRRIAMLLDIQPEIRAAEAAALRDLMQVLSHEIMNALTPVASLAATAIDLLGDGTSASTANARDAVETLARRAGGLSRFVEAYRTLARLPPPTLKPTSVVSVLDEVAQLFRIRWTTMGVTLDVMKPSPDFVANLDLDLLVHALTNLLSNAAYAALAGKGRAPSVALGARLRDGGVSFTVTDSGPGVPISDRDRIFQPFFTTRANGTGVGLSFARQVALSHGGDLSLAPQSVGGGASFDLTI
jgi:two-component system nitrogen regulation sensor histidine kinase NtrY